MISDQLLRIDCVRSHLEEVVGFMTNFFKIDCVGAFLIVWSDLRPAFENRFKWISFENVVGFTTSNSKGIELLYKVRGFDRIFSKKKLC